MMKQTQPLRTWVALALLIVLAVFAMPSIAHADGGGFVPGNAAAESTPASSAVAPTQYTLSVELLEIEAEVGGEAGTTVTSSPAGISCQGICGQSFDQGTVVTLTLTDGTATDWTGCDSSSANQCTVTMNGNKSVVVSFTASQVQGARAERTGQIGLLGALALSALLGIGAYRKLHTR